MAFQDFRNTPEADISLRRGICRKGPIADLEDISKVAMSDWLSFPFNLVSAIMLPVFVSSIRAAGYERISAGQRWETCLMLALRNALLAINGACFLLLVCVIFIAPPDLIHWLPIVILVYFVLDFIYLSLSYPRNRISHYLALFIGNEPPQGASRSRPDE